eukprot:PhF_6_TR8326/c0_g1_i11/m.12986
MMIILWLIWLVQSERLSVWRFCFKGNRVWRLNRIWLAEHRCISHVMWEVWLVFASSSMPRKQHHHILYIYWIRTKPLRYNMQWIEAIRTSFAFYWIVHLPVFQRKDSCIMRLHGLVTWNGCAHDYSSTGV